MAATNIYEVRSTPTSLFTVDFSAITLGTEQQCVLVDTAGLIHRFDDGGGPTVNPPKVLIMGHYPTAVNGASTLDIPQPRITTLNGANGIIGVTFHGNGSPTNVTVRVLFELLSQGYGFQLQTT